MNAYIRVVNGQIDRVYARDDAMQMEEGVANDLRVQAYQKWPDVNWEVEIAGNNEYIVKGERH